MENIQKGGDGHLENSTGKNPIAVLQKVRVHFSVLTANHSVEILRNRALRFMKTIDSQTLRSPEDKQ